MEQHFKHIHITVKKHNNSIMILPMEVIDPKNRSLDRPIGQVWIGDHSASSKRRNQYHDYFCSGIADKVTSDGIPPQTY